jgi:hypothetical protein
MNELSLPNNSHDSWFECNVPLLRATGRPEEHGFATAGDLLAHVARERELTVRALTKQIEAVRFLLVTYPQHVESAPVSGGYSQIEYLRKIHEVWPYHANQLAWEAINGRISMARMRKEFANALEVTGHPGSTGAMARRRVLAFEQACRQVIEDRFELFSNRPDATLTNGFKLHGHTIDYAIHDKQVIYSAVECSSGGMRSTGREAFGMVSTLAMLKRRAQQVWLLLPEAAAPRADAVIEMTLEWGVTDENVGLVAESPEPMLSVKRAVSRP